MSAYHSWLQVKLNFCTCAICWDHSFNGFSKKGQDVCKRYCKRCSGEHERSSITGFTEVIVFSFVFVDRRGVVPSTGEDQP